MSPPPARAGWRERLRPIHRWLGLAACLPLAWQAATGCVLMVAEDWLEPAPAALRAAKGPGHDLAEILAAAQAYEQQHGAKPAQPQALMSPGPGRPVFVRFGTEDLLQVDPHSLTVERRSPGLRAIQNWHQRLLMPQGSAIVGCFGIMLALLGISGTILWWPPKSQWRRVFTPPAAAHYRRGGYRAWRGWHLLLGGATAVMALVVASTGICLAFGIPGNPVVKVPADDPSFPAVSLAPTPLTLDTAVTLALRAVPGTRLRMLALPRHAGQVLRVDLVPAGKSSPGAMASTLTIDPATGSITGLSRRPLDGGTVAVARFIRSTHTGGGFGLAWQIVLLAYGLTLVAMSATGLAMRLRRPRHPAVPSPSNETQHMASPALQTRFRSSTDA